MFVLFDVFDVRMYVCVQSLCFVTYSHALSQRSCASWQTYECNTLQAQYSGNASGRCKFALVCLLSVYTFS